jgi:hypothetical protein
VTLIESVARALYEIRMRQVGIPSFEIVPFDDLPPNAVAVANEAARVAIDIVQQHSTIRGDIRTRPCDPSKLKSPTPSDMMGRRA